MVVRSTLAGDEQTIIFLEKSVQLTTVKTRKINIKKIKTILYATTENSKGGNIEPGIQHYQTRERGRKRETIILRKGRIRPRVSKVDCLVQSTFLRQIFRLLVQRRTRVDHIQAMARSVPGWVDHVRLPTALWSTPSNLGSDVVNGGQLSYTATKLFWPLTAGVCFE